MDWLGSGKRVCGHIYHLCTCEVYCNKKNIPPSASAPAFYPHLCSICPCCRHPGGRVGDAAGWTEIHGAGHDHQLPRLPVPADETGEHDP